MSDRAQPSAARRTSRRRAAHLGTAAILTLGVLLGGCRGDEQPFAKAPATPAATSPVAVEPPPPASTTPASTSPATTPPTSPGEAAPATTPPDSPADAPSPAGVTPDSATKRGKRPHSLSERVAADATAKLNVRTMVSIIEGCHSGAVSYRDCNTHEELGSPDLLGLRIGKARGEVQVSTTENGFRITGHSMSGAKFTVARGPSGDRFKCIQGRMPGACPADRNWSW